MIELKNIYKTYHMGNVEVKALQGVSLKIAPGEFVAIMGPSGSGKSTLMHVLGLLDRPDSGEYYLGKKKINELLDEELSAIRNRLAGFVFQQFHLLPRMTALENAALPLIYAGKRHLKERARQKIEEVGLADRMSHRPNELSGGQQQRVAIARSLVNDPLIIFADEPTGNLDSKSQEEIISILKDLNQKGKTIIMVTHEKEVAAYARRVIRMLDGRIISDEKSGIPAKYSQENQTDKIIEVVLSKSERKAREIEFWDYLRQAAGAMVSHKMRSFLSILGILIGVAAVIAMLAVGQGAKESIESQLASLGSNLLLVRPGSSRMMGVALQAGTVTRFTFQDVSAIEKLSDEVKSVSPSVTGRGQLVYGNKNWNTQIEGVGVDYASIRASQPAVGRFISEDEVKMRDRVVLLGTTVARELFGDANPVGETIKINLLNFKVIGVLPEKGAGGFHDQDDTVLIPVTTAMYRVLGKEYIDSIYVEAKSPDSIDAAQEAITNLIIKQHHLAKDEEDSFQIRNMSDIKNALEATTKTMSLLLGSIAAISLLVGGIGIMNIMLVSVSERTREIGLRKAIGATNKDIMVQFLIEAVLMSFIGGICGVLLGSGISILITLFAGWTVRVSMFSVILATTFSLIVGIVFGLWPAQKASQLDPIEALRYE
ncbi:MAG: ABC transporter permease [Candidatus Omnitrophica bacterium]|nr:ABC transporter permease [Candidatus Omnitrophota bacterium]MDD5352087.1 ABC transporter permease [Candidatus Omnitrophota bacterium]MDD5549685.1 ABC transporter permease [Candidatus Omnitrophota bacterium]